MAHLAGCAECRKIVSLAAVAAPEPQKGEVIAIDRRPRSLIRVWLPVAAAAAGIVIVSAVAYRYVRMSAVSQTAAVEQQRPATTQASPPPAETADAAQANHSAGTPVPDSQKRSQQTAPQQSSTIQAAPATQAIEPSQTASGPSATQMQDKSIGLNPSSPAFANTTTTNALASAPASVARPHWRINEQGQVERAFGNEPWQVVLGADGKKMRVLSVAGAEVWAGGADSKVYRSEDNGQNWKAVTLPAKTSAAIAHIRLESPQEIRIEAADGITWVSTDGGATWK